jgi:hypothetical protein
MSLVVTINQLSSGALPSQWDSGAGFNCTDAPYGNRPNYQDRKDRAYYLANIILEDWGIRYNMGGSLEDNVYTIPYNLVRNPQSEWHIHCDDLDSIFIVAGNAYSDAQDRLDSCGTSHTDLECVCNAEIDKIKWKAIFDWATIAVQYKSSTNDIDACIVDAWQEANFDIQEALHDSLNADEGLGLSSNALMAMVAGVTLVSVGIILKYVK